jgi:hypothetical protein
MWRNADIQSDTKVYTHQCELLIFNVLCINIISLIPNIIEMVFAVRLDSQRETNY